MADTLARVTRYDRGGELLAPQKRPDGSLLCEGFMARPGVMSYRRVDGTVVRELVPRETLHDQASLLTLGRCPVTLEHPHEDVSSDNVQALGVGDVDSEVVIADNGFIRVKLAARRKDAVEAIEDDVKRQLSPGYTCRVDSTPGVDPEFGPYDAIQRDRRYNHLAIVGRARGGPEIHLRADSAEEVEDEARTDPYPNEHAARLVDPKVFETFARKEIAPGVTLILGKRKGGTAMETQAIRFAREKFTAAEAKKWLEANEKKPILFEEATGKNDAADAADAAEPIGAGWMPIASDKFGGEIKAGTSWRNIYRWPSVEKAKEAAADWKARAKASEDPSYCGPSDGRWTCEQCFKAADRFVALVIGGPDWQAMPGDSHNGQHRATEEGEVIHRWPSFADAVAAEQDYRDKWRAMLLASDKPMTRAELEKRPDVYFFDSMANDARYCAEILAATPTMEAKADMDPTLQAFLDAHPEFRRDGLAVKDLLDELFQAMGRAKAELKDALKAHDTTKGERDAIQARCADLEGKLAEMLKAKEEDPEEESESEPVEGKDKKGDAADEQAMIAYACERGPLLRRADALKIDSAKLGNAALRRAIVKAIHPEPARIDSASDDYVHAYFDAAGTDTRWDSLSDAFRKAQEVSHTDGADAGSDWDPTGRAAAKKE